MMMNKFYLLLSLLSLFALSLEGQTDVEKLKAKLLGETPILEDLHELCDQIGGRVTGTKANEKSVIWAMGKLEEAKVKSWREPFEMPRLWSENSATATIEGGSNFSPKIACRAFSTGTPAEGLERELIYVEAGTKADFEKVGKEAINDNFVLVATPVMTNLTELFLEYINAIEIETTAKEMGAAGVVYMSSRAKKLLYRHLTTFGTENDMPMVVMARDDATRCKRLLKRGKKLTMNLKIDVVDAGSYTAHNVFAEIPGSEFPDEIILIGAHLDSWGLGTGANDNGCNVNMMIDIARQMKALDIQPKRTIRFALWNGEEQGMLGSYAYTQKHIKDLDNHKMAVSIDIGSGKINGFFTNGRTDIAAKLQELCKVVEDIGKYEHSVAPIVGTDNYDFLAQGVPNIVGKHALHNYCEDYHSESDTYDKVDAQNLKENTALVGTVMLQFANLEEWPFERQNRADIDKIIEDYTLESGMKALNLWKGWNDGTRGIK